MSERQISILVMPKLIKIFVVPLCRHSHVMQLTIFFTSNQNAWNKVYTYSCSNLVNIPLIFFFC